MSELERPIIEEVLDYAVYAPLGLALTVLEDLPGLVARGKSKVKTQVGVARFAGKLAFGQLRRTLDDILTPSAPTAKEAHGHDGPPITPPAVLVDDSTPPPSAVPAPVVSTTPESVAAVLAIPDYDTLAASQIVARLPGLNRAELRDVKAHEEQHRGRRTIIARIDQLEQGSNGD